MKRLFFFILFPFLAFADVNFDYGKQIAKNDILSQLDSVIYFSSTSIEYMEKNDMMDAKYEVMKGRLQVYEAIRELIVDMDLLLDNSI